MRHDPKLKRSHFVCFHCRKMFRKTLLRFNYGGVAEGKEGLRCAECGGDLVNVGRGFEPPRLHDIKSWKRAALLHTQGYNWFAATDGDCSAARIVGPLKYYAKPPRNLEDQKRNAEEQRRLRCAKDTKKQQRLQKQQERLASRSRTGRSLTNVLGSD